MKAQRSGKRNLWPCQMCAECCLCIPIEASFVERMEAFFQRPYSRAILSKPIQGIVYLTMETPDNKCIFLNKDNKCAIYENSPSICRQFGLSAGMMECHRVTPSGRIRTPEESIKARKRINKLLRQKQKETGDFDSKILGVKYRYDD